MGPILSWTTERMLNHVEAVLEIPGACKRAQCCVLDCAASAASWARLTGSASHMFNESVACSLASHCSHQGC